MSDTFDPARARRFLAACRGEPVDTTPVWIMRQAGRYLPSYRAVRARAGDFLTLCKTPDLAAEVTVQPVDEIGVDAAIVFSDILIPVEAMGVDLTFGEGEGPRLRPVASEADARALHVPVAEERCGFVAEAIRRTVKALDGRVPVIGFAGAPWTVLTYVVEGKTSKDFARARRMLFEAPDVARLVLDKLVATTIDYLMMQVRAGVRALQLFDSWAGALGPDEFRAFSLPALKKIVDALRPTGVPIIYFCNQGAALLADAAKVGADVYGIDYRVPLDEARARLGRPDAVVQGNLDPCALFAAPAAFEPRVAEVLRRGGARHVFNLGHGIQPDTPPEHAVALVEMVHRLGKRSAT